MGMEKRYLNDEEIMALPNWREALNEMIADHKQHCRKEPSGVHIDSLIRVLIQRFRTSAHVRELFLKLQENTVLAFKAYGEVKLAFDNSNLDPLLKTVLDQKESEYKAAFYEFQFQFPLHTV